MLELPLFVNLARWVTGYRPHYHQTILHPTNYKTKHTIGTGIIRLVYWHPWIDLRSPFPASNGAKRHCRGLFGWNSGISGLFRLITHSRSRISTHVAFTRYNLLCRKYQYKQQTTTRSSESLSLTETLRVVIPALYSGNRIHIIEQILQECGQDLQLLWLE